MEKDGGRVLQTISKSVRRKIKFSIKRIKSQTSLLVEEVFYKKLFE